MSSSKDEIAGNAYYIYMTPRATAFPWIKIYRRPQGLKGKGELIGGGYDTKWSLDEIALAIGRTIVENSPILQEWQEWKGSQ